MKTTEVRWGVVGAGDVVERKSGLPLVTVPGSRWIALTRRNPEAARRIADRFGVTQVCLNAEDLIARPEINAVYVATPPSTHAEFAVKALEAGKAVYLEKPMARNADEAQFIVDAVDRTGGKLVVAHYRRAQPSFLKLKELLDGGSIGKVLFVRILLLQPADPSPASAAAIPWRLDPRVSGGGLFHDLSPHQLDLLCHWFGPVVRSSGYAANFAGRDFRNNEREGSQYHGALPPADYVSGRMEFQNGVQFEGTWCFCVDAPERAVEECVIYGSRGRLTFPFFGRDVVLENGEGTKRLPFDPPLWVQEPMIHRTVQYFLGEGGNPSTAAEGLETMKIIDSFSETA